MVNNLCRYSKITRKLAFIQGWIPPRIAIMYSNIPVFEFTHPKSDFQFMILVWSISLSKRECHLDEEPQIGTPIPQSLLFVQCLYVQLLLSMRKRVSSIWLCSTKTVANGNIINVNLAPNCFCFLFVSVWNCYFIFIYLLKLWKWPFTSSFGNRIKFFCKRGWQRCSNVSTCSFYLYCDF